MHTSQFMDLFFEQYFRNMQNPKEFEKLKSDKGKEQEVEIIYEEIAAPMPWMMRSSIYGKDLPDPELSDYGSSSASLATGSPRPQQRIGSVLVPSPLLRLKSPFSERSNDPGRSSPAPLAEAREKLERSPSPAAQSLSPVLSLSQLPPLPASPIASSTLSPLRASQLPPLPDSPIGSPTALSDPSKQLNDFLELQSGIEKANPVDDSPIQGLGGVLYGTSVSPSPSQTYMNRTMWGLGSNLPEDDLVLSDDSVGTRIHKNSAVLEEIAKRDYIHDEPAASKVLFTTGTEAIDKRASRVPATTRRASMANYDSDEPRFAPIVVPVVGGSGVERGIEHDCQNEPLQSADTDEVSAVAEEPQQSMSPSTAIEALMVSGIVVAESTDPVMGIDAESIAQSSNAVDPDAVAIEDMLSEQDKVAADEKSTVDACIDVVHEASAIQVDGLLAQDDLMYNDSKEIVQNSDRLDGNQASVIAADIEETAKANKLIDSNGSDSLANTDEVSIDSNKRKSIKELIQSFEEESKKQEASSSSQILASAVLAAGAASAGLVYLNSSANDSVEDRADAKEAEVSEDLILVEEKANLLGAFGIDSIKQDGQDVEKEAEVNLATEMSEETTDANITPAPIEPSDNTVQTIHENATDIQENTTEAAGEIGNTAIIATSVGALSASMGHGCGDNSIVSCRLERNNRIFELLQELTKLIKEEQSDMNMILHENEELRRQIKK